MREREREREEAQVQSEPLDQEVTSYLNQQTHLLPPIFFCFDLLYFCFFKCLIFNAASHLLPLPNE
jgi:hypothetical protein